jgi:hypothetical protein
MLRGRENFKSKTRKTKHKKDNNMKNKIGISVLAIIVIAGCLIIGANSIVKAAAPQHHDVVVLHATQETAQDGGGRFHYTGLWVYVSSSSDGAPTFPQYGAGQEVALSQALADLLAQGFTITHISDNSLEYVLVR